MTDPSPTSLAAETQERASQLTSALAPFVVTDGGPDRRPRGAVYPRFATPQEMALALADLTARLAAMPADTFQGCNGTLIIAVKPIGDVPDDRVVSIVDAIAEACDDQGRADREIMGNGSVFYNAKITTPAGLPMTSYDAVEPTEVERQDYRRTQGGHKYRAVESAERDGLGRALVNIMCQCGEWASSTLPRGRSLSLWRQHADRVMTLAEAAAQTEAAAQ